MLDKTIAELRRDLQSKTISSVELTQFYVDRIKQHDTKINAFITTTEEQALTQAKQADERIAKGENTPLLGIPIAQKDIFCTEGIKTSCASKMLDPFISPYDATTVKQFNAAGCPLLGKTNMDEFAMGSSNENSFYGPVLNPWDLQRVPGGSSGGSAAAIAARLTPAATGTDTGGSIRQPASLCGITGLKPTYGRVSRYGMIAFASSLDQGGPMTKTAEDAALTLQVMAGFDPLDSTSIDEPIPNYSATLNDDIDGLKIGLPKEFFSKGCDAGVAECIQTALKELEKRGAKLIDISLPSTDIATSVYYVIAPAECSSNLSRYDGVRFGHRTENADTLLELYERSRSEGFGDEVKRRIMTGTYALSSGYYDAYYLKAQRLRRVIRDDFINAFKQVDVIAGPVSPTPAFRLGEKSKDPLAMYLTDIYTISVNLAGLPGISFPAGFSQQLPVGLQLIGNYFEEAKLLNVAHQYQQMTDWHQQMPQGF